MKVHLCALAVAACAIAATTGAGDAAAANKPVAKPVPSLTPAATQKLWQQLVQRGRFRTFDTGDCRPLRALFYAGTDWLRLTTKLAANVSPCAQYYVSVPPVVADKSQPRADQAWRIRALGPNFHAVAEMNVTGWSAWVTNTGGSWFDAGVEARRRMHAAGYDVTLGDTWVVNELSSAVRIGNGNARANMRAFIRGLYTGDGSLPATRGGVFVTGMGQATTELSVYQSRLQEWYEDESFWSDMSAYVSDWSQELYGDVRNYAVAGAPLATRRDSLNDYLQHELALARVAPAPATAARSFIESAYNPLGNAAWQYDAAFGWTNVPVDLMQHYVSAQTYALRNASSARFGFAWQPKNLSSMLAADFTAQTDALLDRLGAAIRDSASTLDADVGISACAQVWCGGDLDGAWLNDRWQTFDLWKPSQLAFTTAPQALAAGTASAPITVELRTNTGLAYAAGLPVSVTLTSTSATGRFATTSTGPWSATLTTEIANGATSVSFHYQDSAPGSATIAAAAANKAGASQGIDVSAGALAQIAVSPSPVSLATGASQSFTAAGFDAYGNSVPLDGLTWTSTAPGTLAATSGASTVFTAGGVGGSGSVVATAGGVSGTAAMTVVAPVQARVQSVSYARYSSTLYVTIKLVDGSGDPLSGAAVSYRIARNGYLYTSRSGTSAADGTVRTTLYNLPGGCYTTTVTSVSAPGWDAATPGNQYCK